jgi:hypothetical protein
MLMRAQAEANMFRIESGAAPEPIRDWRASDDELRARRAMTPNHGAEQERLRNLYGAPLRPSIVRPPPAMSVPFTTAFGLPVVGVARGRAAPVEPLEILTQHEYRKEFDKSATRSPRVTRLIRDHFCPKISDP